MKVFENIKKLGSSIDFERIVRDLLPLRNSESKTYEYIESFLHSDKRLKLWKEDRREAEVNGVLGLNPELQEFVLREGEVDPYDAPDIRKALLQLIKDDKVSFAYLYYILGSEQNRIAGYTIYNCIPPSEEAIDYAIRFDTDILKEYYDGVNDTKDIVKTINGKLYESQNHSYCGELKERFEESCNFLKNCLIEERSCETSSKRKKAGRPPKGSFADFLVGSDTTTRLKELHTKYDGKTGQHAVQELLKEAIGIHMEYPSYNSFNSEFEGMVQNSSYYDVVTNLK